jgi:hypothetical protein
MTALERETKLVIAIQRAIELLNEGGASRANSVLKTALKANLSNV